jgi:hypothetical protein
MIKHLRRNTRPRELPKEVRATLVSQFRLDEEAIGKLDLFEEPGRFAGRPVRFVRLVDSTLRNVDTKARPKYGSFDDANYQKAVQFEGHIEREGYVLLHDRRPRQG